MNILDAMADPNLFARWFKNPDDWRAWRAFLAVLFALPLDDNGRVFFEECTGRTTPPAEPFNEAWLVCGRRAGKSFVMALAAVYLATFRDYRAHLAPGERATIMLIATDRKQARVLTRYIRALLLEVPMLRRMVERETAESFDLARRVTIEVATASYRTIRGYTLAAAILDEIAFWPSDDAAEPDRAILDALRPAMATLPGSVLLAASSPYTRRGALYEAHRRHYAHDGSRVLVWQAATRVMNPTVPQSVIDDAIERDPASAAAEYLAEFRADIEGFLAVEQIRRVTDAGIAERLPVLAGSTALDRDREGHVYSAFCDPSGGSADSMTLGIAHIEDGQPVLDLLREIRPPFNPQSVVAEFTDTLKRYRIREVSGDRYGGQWVSDSFERHGVRYWPSSKNKNDLYLALLPLVNAGECRLLDNQRLHNQLTQLERRTSRTGRDSIDHPPGAHDDLANAAAGAIVLAKRAVQCRTVTAAVRGLY